MSFKWEAVFFPVPLMEVSRGYTGLAMDCQMHQRDREDWKELWFFDTIRPHMFEGEIVRES